MAFRWGLITAQASADWHARRLARALGATGTVETLDPSDLRLLCGRAHEGDLLMVVAAGHDARRFDAVVIGHIATDRADAELQLDVLRSFDLIDIPCINRVGPMLSAQDKLWTAAVLAHAGVPTPLCSSVPTRVDVLQATAEIGKAVAKPVFGSLGDGLFRCDTPSARTRLAKSVRSEPFLVQRFVPPGGVDYRLFVVGDRVEACIRRQARRGEWRSNIARGGQAVEIIPHRLWRELAVESTRALGLDVAGVDLALGDEGPMVLEVNGFPHFHGIYQASGRDMAPAIAARVLRVARASRRRALGKLRA